MTLRAPDGTGIKGGIVNYHVQRMLTGLALEGGIVNYHVQRMLTGLALVAEFPLDSDFVERLIVYHARLAARAALNQMYNGRRPQ